MSCSMKTLIATCCASYANGPQVSPVCPSNDNYVPTPMPFLRFGEILMYCHILRVRAIPTLESTDSMILLHDREGNVTTIV